MMLEIISNGLGAQSMRMLQLAAQGIIPAQLSITGDTGSEEDRVWSDGTRNSAQEYFNQIVRPYAERYGLEATLVKSEDKYHRPLPTLWQHTARCIEEGRLSALTIPLFGSNGGQRNQSCTDKWKMRAVRQEARRRGATLLRSAVGLHRDEFARRARGANPRDIDGWTTWNTQIKVKGVNRVSKWLLHYYPLVELNETRRSCQEALEAEGIPYLLSSECDHCPHKNWLRWSRSSTKTVERIAEAEARMNGEFFFTDLRIPLKEALAILEREASQPNFFDDPDFGCGNLGCGM